jgi:hypothetical protein
VSDDPQFFNGKVLALRVSPTANPSPAARAAFIAELLAPPIYCECGCDCIVGTGEPLIDRETALAILDSTSAKATDE